VARRDAKRLRSPEGLACIDPGPALNATLRPYQQVGVRWLYLLAKLGLGHVWPTTWIGQDIQVLSLLLVLKRQAAGRLRPSLLVARLRAGELGSRDRRFAPGLKALIAILRAPGCRTQEPSSTRLSGVDLSSPAMAHSPHAWIAETSWIWSS